MQNKIDFIVIFSIGYWTGQIKHGWEGYLLSMILIIIDLILVALVKRAWKKHFKKDNIIKETTEFIDLEP